MRRALLAHVNYCDDVELDMLARGRASVVWCPRTHRYFDHPPHRWREMLARGINVAVATDSCASSPDLNILNDLRLIRSIAQDVFPPQLFELVTTRAALALGMSSEVGAIAPGLRADLVVLDGEDVDFEALRAPSQMGVALFSGNSNRVRDVYVGGRAVVEDGRHGSEEEALAAFRRALARLRAAP